MIFKLLSKNVLVITITSLVLENQTFVAELKLIDSFKLMHTSGSTEHNKAI